MIDLAGVVGWGADGLGEGGMTMVLGVRGTAAVELSGRFATGELDLLELPLRTLLALLMNLDRRCFSSDGPPAL